jgi:subtilisin-like proprotein convertase family protein
VRKRVVFALAIAAVTTRTIDTLDGRINPRGVRLRPQRRGHHRLGQPHRGTGGSADNIDQTFTVNLSSEVANGTWNLRVQDAAAADTGFINSWTLNLAPAPPPPPCTATNGTDVPIPDLSTVNSPITISGCPGNGSATSTVEVHIVHIYVGDLIVSLVAPDGTIYTLRNRTGGSAVNLDQTFSVNLSSEVRNGTWNLRVQDAAAADTGFINSWTLTL